MSTERLSVRKIREVVRLKWELKQSHREISVSLGVSVGVITKVLSRVRAAGLNADQVAGFDEGALEQLLYGPRLPATASRPAPDPVWIHTELKKRHVTLQLLHLEYLQAHADGYRYSQFCDVYRRWLYRQHPRMRQHHKAGKRLFVDYSGKGPFLFDPVTGERRPVELFVAALGASNYTYAEATETQQGRDFIDSHIRTYEFLGGVPEITTPDQLKPAVARSCWYDPVIQRTYEEMAEHYGCAVLPARPKRPRDKAKVEVGVQVVQRWVLARLRNERYFDLASLNARIAELVADLNQRPMRTYGGKSRQQLFEEIDRPALQPLPEQRFRYGEWKTARVHIDYHVEVAKHFYSVPYTLMSETVEVRVSGESVEIFHRGRRVAAHLRSTKVGSFTTVDEHMPKAHRAHRDWSPGRLLGWAAGIGPQTAELVKAILAARRHPEQGYRACLGLLALAKNYGRERLEGASRRALTLNALRVHHIRTILQNGLDRVPVVSEPLAESSPTHPVHENIRGPGYYA